MRDYNKMTDDELLRRSSELDERAFEVLYTRYESLVYNLAYFKMKNREDALDVAQNAFLKLWRGASSYRGNGSVAAFIHTIVRNAAADAIRQRQEAALPLYTTDSDGTEQPLPVADDADTPEQATMRRADVLAVRAAIAELDDHHRDVIILYELEGKSYTETAAALDIDVGTVKSRLFRARKRLAEILSKKGTKPHFPTSI